MADRVVVMENGRIAQIGTPRELYERPATQKVAAFVGHANLWPGVIAGPDSVETPVGRLVTAPHGARTGAAVTVLVRPERVRVGGGADRVNTIRGQSHARPLSRRLRRFDFAVGGGHYLRRDHRDAAPSPKCISARRPTSSILPDASSNQRRNR